MRSLKKSSYQNSPTFEEPLPSFTVHDKNLPEAKKWKVGKKYKIQIEVEMMGTRKEKHAKPEHLVHSFEITKIGVPMSEKEFSARRGNV